MTTPAARPAGETAAAVKPRRTTAHTAAQLQAALGWDQAQFGRAVACGLIPAHDMKTPRWSGAVVDGLVARRDELAAAIPDLLDDSQLAVHRDHRRHRHRPARRAQQLGDAARLERRCPHQRVSRERRPIHNCPWRPEMRVLRCHCLESITITPARPITRWSRFALDRGRSRRGSGGAARGRSWTAD
ncbi:MAG TPA: hypothetical protein VFV66_24040 [Nonomuraea sp.]|nr:hypothetical protein [Nonomuraea sp.]